MSNVCVYSVREGLVHAVGKPGKARIDFRAELMRLIGNNRNIMAQPQKLQAELAIDEGKRVMDKL